MTIATIIALILLGCLTIFQLALIIGAPIGKFSWGGAHKVLPTRLRIASASSIVIYVIFAIIIASKHGFWQIIPAGNTLDILTWVLFAYFVLGVFMNAISKSKLERYTMTPVALVLAICLYVLASSLLKITGKIESFSFGAAPIGLCWRQQRASYAILFAHDEYQNNRGENF